MKINEIVLNKLLECNVWAFFATFQTSQDSFYGWGSEVCFDYQFFKVQNISKFQISLSFVRLSRSKYWTRQEWICQNLKALSLYFWLGFVVPQLLHSISVYNIMKRTFSLGV